MPAEAGGQDGRALRMMLGYNCEMTVNDRRRCLTGMGERGSEGPLPHSQLLRTAPSNVLFPISREC